MTFTVRRQFGLGQTFIRLTRRLNLARLDRPRILYLGIHVTGGLRLKGLVSRLSNSLGRQANRMTNSSPVTSDTFRILSGGTLVRHVSTQKRTNSHRTLASRRSDHYIYVHRAEASTTRHATSLQSLFSGGQAESVDFKQASE